MSVTAIPESPLLHPRSMPSEVQLRVPPTTPHRLDHQETIVVDDSIDSPELMATSPPRPNIHNPLTTLDAIDTPNENLLNTTIHPQSQPAESSGCLSTGVSSGLSQAQGGPLSDTSNSNIASSVSSKYSKPQATPALPATGSTASKHNNTTSSARINPNEKVMYGELVVLG